tara:strand:+ start:26516 stop:27322 length:807 start_codon:yes stop_codon:yes gene_type:complete
MGDVVKKAEKAVKSVKKATGIDKVEKAVKKTVKSVPVVGDVYKESEKAISNVRKEADRVWEKNKDGVNATAGLIGRGAAAYYTLGASELVGGGNYLTKQFGGSKKTSQYGQLAGTIGGAYGAANALGSLAGQGVISQSAANVGGTAATSIISQRASGNAVDAGRTIASVGGAAIDESVKSNIGSNGMNESNFWEDQWNQYGGQVVDSVLGNLLGSSKGGEQPKPISSGQQPIVVQTPGGSNNGGDNEKMMMMLAGGLGLVTLLVLLRK